MSELFEKISKMSTTEERIYLENELANDPEFLTQLSDAERLETVDKLTKETEIFYASLRARVVIAVKAKLPEALKLLIDRADSLLFGSKANVGVLLAAYLLVEERYIEAAEVIRKLKKVSSRLKYRIFIEEVADKTISELSEWNRKEENRFFLKEMIIPMGNIPGVNKIESLIHDAIIEDKTDILAHSFVRIRDDYAIYQGLYTLCKYGLKDKKFELKCLHQSLCGLSSLDPTSKQETFYRRTKSEYAKLLGILNAVLIEQRRTEMCEGYDFHVSAGEYYFEQLNGSDPEIKKEIDSVQNAVSLSLRNIDANLFEKKCEAYYGFITCDWTPLIRRWIDHGDNIYDILRFPEELDNLEACGFAKSFLRLLIDVPENERERLIERFFKRTKIKREIYQDSKFVKMYILNQYGNHLKVLEKSIIDQNAVSADVLLRLPLEDSVYFRVFRKETLLDDKDSEYYYSRIYLIAAMCKSKTFMTLLSTWAYNAFVTGLSSTGNERSLNFLRAAKCYLCLYRITLTYLFLNEEESVQNQTNVNVYFIRERYEALHKNSLVLSGNHEMITAYAEMDHPWSAINRLMACVKTQTGNYIDNSRVYLMKVIAEFYPGKFRNLPEILEFCIVNQNVNSFEMIIQKIDSCENTGLRTCLYRMLLLGKYFTRPDEVNEIKTRYSDSLSVLKIVNEEYYKRMQENKIAILCYKPSNNQIVNKSIDQSNQFECEGINELEMKAANNMCISVSKNASSSEKPIYDLDGIKESIRKSLDDREQLYACLNDIIEPVKYMVDENDLNDLKEFITHKVVLKVFRPYGKNLSDTVRNYSNHKEIFEFVCTMASSGSEILRLVTAICDLFRSTEKLYKEWTNEPEEREMLKNALDFGIKNISTATSAVSIKRLKSEYERLIKDEKKNLEDVPKFKIYILNIDNVISDDCIYGYVENIGKREAKNITLTADFDYGIVASEEKYLEILRPGSNASFMLCFEHDVIEEKEGNNLVCTINISGEYNNGVYSGEEIEEEVSTLTINPLQNAGAIYASDVYETRTLQDFVYNETTNDVECEGFIGRDNETFQLRGLVEGDKFINYRSAIMYGVKRTGKSSLLNYFQKYLEAVKSDELNVVMVDCQYYTVKEGNAEYTKSQYVFINRVLDRLDEDKKYGDALKGMRETWYTTDGMVDDIYERLPVFYRNLKEITGKGLFLLIDESDLLFSRPDGEKIKKMFSAMVGSADCSECVHFLICGSNMTIRYRQEAGSKDQMFQRFGEGNIIEVGKLPYEDMKTVLREPRKAKHKITFVPEAEEKIWDYTGGLVWITKILANEVVNTVANTKHRTFIYPSDISDAIDGITVETNCVQFDEGCKGPKDDDMDSTEMKLIDAIQSVANWPGKYIDLSEIISLLEKHNLYPGDEELKRAMDMLLELKVIESDPVAVDHKRYRFSIDIYRRYFRSKVFTRFERGEEERDYFKAIV